MGHGRVTRAGYSDTCRRSRVSSGASIYNSERRARGAHALSRAREIRDVCVARSFSLSLSLTPSPPLSHFLAPSRRSHFSRILLPCASKTRQTERVRGLRNRPCVDAAHTNKASPPYARLLPFLEKERMHAGGGRVRKGRTEADGRATATLVRFTSRRDAREGRLVFSLRGAEGGRGRGVGQAHLGSAKPTDS